MKRKILLYSSQYIRKKREILPKRFEQRLNNFSKNDGISSFIRRQRIQTDPLKGFNYLINSNRTLSKVFDRFWPNDLPLYPKLKYISSPTTNLHPFESGTDPKSWSRLFPAIWPTVNFVQVACGIARDENGCLVERISIHSQRSKNPSAGERGRTEPWGGLNPHGESADLPNEPCAFSRTIGTARLSNSRDSSQHHYTAREKPDRYIPWLPYRLGWR